MRNDARVWLCLWCAISAGCLDRELEPLSPCLVSAVVDHVQVDRIDKVDLLFVVDSSRSMEDEQALLERQFPNLIRALTTGDRDGDGTRDFEPATDLHLAVVSTDLGVPGASSYVMGCTEHGDDAIFNSTPRGNVAGCGTTYPRFLTYRADVHEPAAVAADFGCIARVGFEGCGFEQQLEAGLKALWPSSDPLIPFLTDAQGAGGTSHGDGVNAGFLRSEDQGLSVLAIVLVSDEEDCSAMTMNDIASVEPGRLGLRCFDNKHVLFPISRYVDGYKLLRPTRPDLVLFAAIVGVPEDLVTREVLNATDFKEPGDRDAFYDRILNDPRMQEVIEDPTAVQPRLRTSCENDNPPPGVEFDGAYPPRRIVEVARGFGENGLVQSICGDDFTPAMDALIRLIGSKLDSVCLPRKLVRDDQGMVRCDVIWQLPRPDDATAPAGTPRSCGERDYLEPVDGPPGEGARCRVRQLPIASEAQVSTAGPQGWYYDDFSATLADGCSEGSRQRVAFTDGARPPNGVRVDLQCLEERPRLPGQGSGEPVLDDQPKVGDACAQVGSDGTVLPDDAACAVRLAAPTERFPDAVDRTMICHPKANVCVQPCVSSADCSAGWTCDDRPETLAATASAARPGGTGICVNPTCGTEP